MKQFALVGALFLVLIHAAAAQPAGGGAGPSGQPTPWNLNGNQIWYPGCVLVGLQTYAGCVTGVFLAGSSGAGATFNIAPGFAPTSPNNGDVWATSAGLFYRAGGNTVGPLLGAYTFTASVPLVVTFPGAEAVNYAINFNTSLALDGSNNLGLNLTHSNTFSAAQTIDNSLTLAPTAGSTTQALIVNQTGPSSGTAAGPVIYNLMQMSSGVQPTGSGLDSFGLFVAQTNNLRVTANVSSGNGGTVFVNGLFATKVTALSGVADAVGLAGVVYSNVSNNTGGFFEAFNAYASLGASANVNILAAIDADVNIATGGAAAYRLGLFLASQGNVQGSTMDAAVSLGSTGLAFKKLFELTSFQGGNPVNSSSDFFFSDAAMTTNNIFNLPNVTVTGDILDFPNAVLTGSGALLLNSPTGSVPAGSVNVSNGYYVNGSPITPVAGGVSGTLLQGVTGSAPVYTATPTLGGSLTIAPTSGTNTTALTVTQTGSTASVAGPLFYNVLNITAQGTVTGAGNDAFGTLNTNADGFRVNMTLSGSSIGANPNIAGLFATRINTTTTVGDVVGVAGVVYTNVTSSGAAFEGMNPYASVGASGTAANLIALEADAPIATGGIVTNRMLFWLNVAGPANASNIDAALLFSSQSGDAFFKKVFEFSTFAGQHVVNSSSDIFYADNAVTVANVFNMSNMTVTGNIMSFPTYTVAGSGQTTIGINGNGTTSVNGLTLQNTTAATSSVQQWSPRLRWSGQGWSTTNTASYQIDWIAEVRPVSNTTAPNSVLGFSTQVNGGGYIPIMSISYLPNGNSLLTINASSGDNSNVVLQNNGTNEWYMENNGGSSNAYVLLNSDGNGNQALLSMTQAGAMTVPGAIATPTVYGGSGASSTLTLTSTSGAGTTDKIIFETASQHVAGFVNTSQQWMIGGSLSNTPGTSAVLSVSNQAGVPSPAPFLNSITSNPLIQLVADNTHSAGMELDSAANNGTTIVGVATGGTIASPTATGNGTFIWNLNGVGYDGTSYGIGGGLHVETAQAWTPSAHGTLVYIAATAFGATSQTTVATFQVGVQVGAPTGGDKGAGTINVSSGIFLNGTAYTNPDYALEDYFTGKIIKFAKNPGASTYQGLLPLDELEGFMRANDKLPGMTRVAGRPVDIFERADIDLEKIEELAIYITQLNDKIHRLETKRHFH